MCEITAPTPSVTGVGAPPPPPPDENDEDANVYRGKQKTPFFPHATLSRVSSHDASRLDFAFSNSELLRERIRRIRFKR